MLRSLNTQIITSFLLALWALAPGAAQAAPYDLDGWLEQPGVQVVIVDFYASGCGPCRVAAPLWRDMHNALRSKGVRLAVVHYKDPDGPSQPRPAFKPDWEVVDPDGAVGVREGIAERLPAVRIYNWQRELVWQMDATTDSKPAVYVAEARAAVERYLFETAPRVALSGPAKLRQRVRRALRGGKIKVIPTEAESKLLAGWRQARNGPNYKGRARLGQELGHNAVLTVSDEKTASTITLQLFGLDDGSLLHTSSAPYGPAVSRDAAVQTALARLESKLKQSTSTPAAPLTPSRDLEQDQDRLSRATTEWDERIAPLLTAGSAGAKARVELDAFAERWGDAVLAEEVARGRELLDWFERDDTPDVPTTSLSHEVHNAGIDWVRLEAGTFEMGSTHGEEDEWPVRSVTLDAFELSRSEVTVEQYARCVEAGVCAVPTTGGRCTWNKPGGASLPINCVDWAQAQTFAAWANARLPTEAEWEYAARSEGRRRPFPWGSARPNRRRAVMGRSHRRRGVGATAVCKRRSGNTDQGICDMAGNLSEWTQDTYGDYLDAPSDGSASVKSSGHQHQVVRGGSWHASGAALRTTARTDRDPTRGGDDIGFRLARSAPSGVRSSRRAPDDPFGPARRWAAH